MRNKPTKRKNLFYKILSATAGLTLLAMAPTAAFAHTDVFFGLNLGGLFTPAYAPPPAVLYGPPPVYYAPAPRVYYAPRRVYYGYDGWHRHEWHGRDDERYHDWHHGERHDRDHHGRH